MTKLEQQNLKRNIEQTKAALAHKDGHGRPIEQPEVISKSVGKKDENGEVVIPDTVGSRGTRGLETRKIEKG